MLVLTGKPGQVPCKWQTTVDYAAAWDDGRGSGDNQNSAGKVPVKSAPSKYQYSVFDRLEALPVAQPTVSKHWGENGSKLTSIANVLLQQNDPITDTVIWMSNSLILY